MTVLFPDRQAPPDPDAVASLIGEAGARWRRLAGWMATTYGIEPEPVWFGSDGWAIRYRRSGRTLTSLIPRPDGFRALVVVGPAVAPGVADLELSATTRQAFDTAKPYPDGRWLFLRVERDEDVDDIERLVALKSPPPRRPRRREVAG